MCLVLIAEFAVSHTHTHNVYNMRYPHTQQYLGCCGSVHTPPTNSQLRNQFSKDTKLSSETFRKSSKIAMHSVWKLCEATESIQCCWVGKERDT